MRPMSFRAGFAEPGDKRPRKPTAEDGRLGEKAGWAPWVIRALPEIDHDAMHRVIRLKEPIALPLYVQATRGMQCGACDTVDSSVALQKALHKGGRGGLVSKMLFPTVRVSVESLATRNRDVTCVSANSIPAAIFVAVFFFLFTEGRGYPMVKGLLCFQSCCRSDERSLSFGAIGRPFFLGQLNIPTPFGRKLDDQLDRLAVGRTQLLDVFQELEKRQIAQGGRLLRNFKDRVTLGKEDHPSTDYYGSSGQVARRKGKRVPQSLKTAFCNLPEAYEECKGNLLESVYEAIDMGFRVGQGTLSGPGLPPYTAGPAPRGEN